MENKTRIMIVEDHHIFRMGLAELINQEEDLEVCGAADNIEQAWQQINDLLPNMVIVDISLKDGLGLELIEKAHQQYPELLMLVLSMHDESLYAERSLMAGARGYIMKQETSDSVIGAIRQVLEGQVYVSEKYMTAILETFINKTPGIPKFPLKNLTNRELEVFTYIGQGLTTSDIAQKLNLGVKTIGTYRERIKDKLNLKNANELITHAVRWYSTR